LRVILDERHQTVAGTQGEARMVSLAVIHLRVILDERHQTVEETQGEARMVS